MFVSTRLSLFGLIASLTLVGCKRDKQPDATATAPSADKQPAAPTTQPAKGRKAELFSIPVGPKLGVFPGQGIGPIRFGATLRTIERLMEAPCSEKTQTLCRYAAHAVDFHLEDGVLVKIQIQGDERPFGDSPEHTYGIFNGRFPQGAELGMYPKYIASTLGEPERKEQVREPEEAAPGLVERHYYKDFTLEFDKLKNGNVVLSSIILEKPPTLILRPPPSAKLVGSAQPETEQPAPKK